MKTAKQIKRWLERHKWYGAFKDQVVCKDWNFLTGAKGKVLDGEIGRNTIAAGFLWSDSNEGFEFWSKIDLKFRK